MSRFWGKKMAGALLPVDGNGENAVGNAKKFDAFRQAEPGKKTDREALKFL
jgi:hypothetical protein